MTDNDILATMQHTIVQDVFYAPDPDGPFAAPIRFSGFKTIYGPVEPAPERDPYAYTTVADLLEE